MASNAAVAGSFNEVLIELGGIAAHRVRREPAPGGATVADLLKANDSTPAGNAVKDFITIKIMRFRLSPNS